MVVAYNFKWLPEREITIYKIPLLVIITVLLFYFHMRYNTYRLILRGNVVGNCLWWYFSINQD